MIIGTQGSTPGGTPPGPKQLLGQILKGMELITEPQIQEALLIQQSKAGRIGQILLRLGYVSKDEAILALAVQQNVDPSELENIDDLEDIL